MLLRDILWTYTVFVLNSCVFDLLPSIFFHSTIFFKQKNGLIPKSFPPLIHHIMTLTPSLCSLRCIAVAEPLPGLSCRYQALEYTSEMQDMSPRNPLIHTASYRLQICVALNKNTHGLMMTNQHFKLPSLGSCCLEAIFFWAKNASKIQSFLQSPGCFLGFGRFGWYGHSANQNYRTTIPFFQTLQLSCRNLQISWIKKKLRGLLTTY